MVQSEREYEDHRREQKGAGGEQSRKTNDEKHLGELGQNTPKECIMSTDR